MTGNVTKLLTLAGLIAVASGAILFGSQRPASLSHRPAGIDRQPYDASLTPKTITFYENRVRRDPIGVIDRWKLADLYLQRCRESGDIAEALRAEKVARDSIRIVGIGNPSAYRALVQSLLAQHRFREALAEVNRGSRRTPADSGLQRLRAEILLEVGDYEAADKAIRSFRGPIEIGRRVLYARSAQLHGHSDEARRLLTQACEEVDKNIDMPGESVAWFHVKLGDLLALMGKSGDAELAYRDALTIFPYDYRALAGLARIASSRGDHQAAIDWGRRSAEIVPAPDVLGIIADAYTALRDRDWAAREFRLIDSIAKLSRATGTVYDRQRALFLADHNRNLDEALALARRELQQRKDIYTYDTLAWVCFKAGHLKEAAEYSRRASALHTNDPLILRHAGKIAAVALTQQTPLPSAPLWTGPRTGEGSIGSN